MFSRKKSHGNTWHAVQSSLFSFAAASTGRSVAVLSPQRAGLQIDRLAIDVVPESKAPRPDTVLAVIGLHAPEFLDEIPVATVIRVLLEGSDNARVVIRQFRMVGNQLFQLSIENGWL